MKCDIILPVWNQLDMTKACLASLLETVDVSARIIVVDNASTDGTADYLRSVRGNDRVRIEVQTNSENLGFGGGVNQGLKSSDAPYVCILNNDTLFGPQWLSTMIELASRGNRLGVLNPESNTFGAGPGANGRQDPQAIARFAKELQPLRREYSELGNCIGFCMLVKREVLREIGGFDHGYFTAFFEDTDFCMRAKRANYQCVKAAGAYVWHEEHKSVGALPTREREKLFRENRALYEKKWGRILRVLFPYVYKGREGLRNTLFDLYPLARNECYVDFWPFHKDREAIQDVYRYSSLRSHANVRVRPSKQSGSPGIFLETLWRVMTKRKKPYDVLFFNDLDMAHAFSRLQWLHRKPIYMQRGGVEDLGKCFGKCNVHVLDNFQKLVAMKKE